MKSIKFLICVNLIALFFIGCGNDEVEKTEEHHEHSKVVKLSGESIKEIKLETTIVSLQPFTGYLTIPAKVVTNQDNEAQIGSLIQGRVNKVYVKIGDYVKAGQVLMTVEGLEVGVVKAGFLIAKANLSYKKANFDRQQKLFAEKIGSQKTVLEAQADYEKALAEYKAEDKKIHSVGLSDEDISDNEEHTSGTLPIKSSISGIVVERNVVIGQLIDATTNAFKIINTNSVWIDGQIYEKDLSKLSQVTKAEFKTSYQDENFEGKIIYTGQTVDENTRTIIVRGEFNNPGNKLKPQMFGELKIPLAADNKAILLHDEVVVNEAGETYVFVQTNEAAFEQRKVVTGVSFDNLTEIKEGLKQGERVVSKGVFYLKSELKKDEIAEDEH